MQINRGLVFWGVALITAGVVALAIQGGVIDGEQARQAWRLWPVVLIVIGLTIIAARTPFALVATLIAGLAVGGLAGTLVTGWPDGMSIGCGGEADQVLSDGGTFDGAAEVDLDFDCGELAVSLADGSDWSLDARYAGDSQPTVSSSAGSLRVVAEGDSFPPFGEGRQEWDVELPRETEMDLEVDANAASSDLDLSAGQFSALGVDANAGSVVIDLAGAEVAELSVDANAGSIKLNTTVDTRIDGSIQMNAGSMDVCIPDGAAFAITLETDNITFSHNLDDSGLTRQGDTWSGGDGTAAITLRVEGNAASFTLNPDGGCQ